MPFMDNQERLKFVADRMRFLFGINCDETANLDPFRVENNMMTNGPKSVGPLFNRTEATNEYGELEHNYHWRKWVTKHELIFQEVRLLQSWHPGVTYATSDGRGCECHLIPANYAERAPWPEARDIDRLWETHRSNTGGAPFVETIHELTWEYKHLPKVRRLTQEWAQQWIDGKRQYVSTWAPFPIDLFNELYLHTRHWIDVEFPHGTTRCKTCGRMAQIGVMFDVTKHPRRTSCHECKLHSARMRKRRMSIRFEKDPVADFPNKKRKRKYSKRRNKTFV